MHPQGMHTLLALTRIRSHSYTVHMWILDPWAIRVDVRGSDGGNLGSLNVAAFVLADGSDLD